MNSPINLHWNNEVCIADGLQKDAKQRKDSKLAQFTMCSKKHLTRQLPDYLHFSKKIEKGKILL